jgi:DNA repair exonuclease SbcCD ATPase subunit
MLKFKILKFKNFLSSGNQFTEIELDKATSTLIVGHNGSGKSTMLDALTFVLFNKPFRKISKTQLVNSINEKECVVEVEFSIGKDNWKLIRGIKPTIFEVYKNKTLLDQLASANDQQKWLEQSVLKLNYKSFTQIVVLGSSNFVPFMQLSSQHRREVVEDLLDIKVFSSMNDISKFKIRELKDEIKEYSYKKENVEDKIESQESLIKELEKRNSADIKEKEEKKLSIETIVDCLNVENFSILNSVDTKQKELETYSNSSNKLKKLENLKVKLFQKVSNIIEDQTFFKDNVVCPTCTQELDEKFRLNKIADIDKKSTELKSACDELEETIQEEQNNESKFLKITKEITKLNNEININNTKSSELSKQIRNLQEEIQGLISRNKNTDTEYEKLISLKQSLDDIQTDIAKRKEELSNYEFIHLLLKDDGAKTKIIKKYLPIINHNLNKFLEIMEFPVNFTLDEEFNEKSFNPIYEDFSYSSFSEGEKMRIDLALLFTWREVAKLKNSINTNLLILDEVFDSSLDESGTDYFTKIIKYIISDSNTFVISHKVDDLFDKFDRTIRFQKQKGFGVMIDS